MISSNRVKLNRPSSHISLSARTLYSLTRAMLSEGSSPKEVWVSSVRRARLGSARGVAGGAAVVGAGGVAAGASTRLAGASTRLVGGGGSWTVNALESAAPL